MPTPYPDSDPQGSDAAAVDPTALSPGAEAAFAGYWRTWTDLHAAATAYLEAVRHLVTMTGGDQDEQLEALAKAMSEAGQLLDMAHAATARGVR